MSTTADHYGPACDLVPNTLGRVRGWYIIAANGRVEAGAFATEHEAELAMDWLWQEGRGVHPAPWDTAWARHGLLIGTRLRTARRRVPPNDS